VRAVLPVGAVEQHGPHMPISTDIATIEGVVAATAPKLPDDLPVLFLPPTAYGKSNEHSLYPGTVTLSAQTLMALWMDIGASVARAGVRKLVFFNAHGGQMNVMDIVTRDLRERHSMMIVAANWYTLGQPPGMFTEHELRHGIHAGDLETSVMLALAPQTVQMQHARHFRSLTERLAEENRFLSITPTGKLGWPTQDLNRQGPRGAGLRQRPFHRAAARGAALRPGAAGEPAAMALSTDMSAGDAPRSPGPLRWPDTLPQACWMSRARVPPALREGLESGLCALRVEQGQISQVLPQPAFDALGGAGLPVLDLDGSTVLSSFVDPHTHLDKGDLCAAGLVPERDLFAAITRVRGDYVHWSAEELSRRIDFALRSAYAHGTRALNSYCDQSQ
jgi:creatinine amidohydrolase